MPNRMEEYSVWKPPTSSESASVKSKGGRVNSAVMAIMKKMNGKKPSRIKFQFQKPLDCAATMARVEMEWLTKTTVTTVMPNAASYEMTWAEARTDPRSGYFDPDDHPASITPYTAMPDMAKTSRIPTGGSDTWSSKVWLPSLMMPPTGTTAKVMKAGTVERYG